MAQIDLPQTRRSLIADRLAAGQSVIAAELAVEFGLSEDAIRRDLRTLAAQGICRRVYGGAVPIVERDRPMAARLLEKVDQKTALAMAGAQAVQAGEFLFLDTGSSNLALVDFLPEDVGLTIATNSVDIAAAVLQRQDLQLIMLGGEVDRHIGGCVDGTAMEAVQRMRIDRAFVGVCAISPVQGVMASHYGDAHFKRLLVAHSETCCALVTNEKLLARGAHQVGNLSCLQMVVLEHNADRQMAGSLLDAGIQVIFANEE